MSLAAERVNLNHRASPLIFSKTERVVLLVGVLEVEAFLFIQRLKTPGFDSGLLPLGMILPRESF